MKKLNCIWLLLISFIVVFTACDKESSSYEENEAQKIFHKSATINQTVSIEDAMFILNEGRELVKISDLKPSDETHFIYQFEKENYAFDSDASFLEWAKKRKSRAIFIEKYKLYKSEQEFAIRTGIIDDEAASQKYVDSFKEQSSNSRRVAFIFDNEDLRDILMPIPIRVPYMGKFKNRAESAEIIAGIIGLCDKSWYRGTKMWFGGIGSISVRSFGSMNNRTESIL